MLDRRISEEALHIAAPIDKQYVSYRFDSSVLLLIALLLWGLHMVQSGIQRAFGPSLRRLLGIALGNRVKAFCVGLVVTAGLQSSTATALMISSFAAAGLVDLVPALAVMLGAMLGTTLIVQALAFDVYRAAPVLVLVGVLLFDAAPPPVFGISGASPSASA